jgi:hypothetical protein
MSLTHLRLSDRILDALELAIVQNDLDIAILLDHALDKAMTRKTGGGEFVERRSYTERMENAQERLSILKKQG